MLLGLLITVFVLALIGGIIFAWWMFDKGRTDANGYYPKYDNKYSGVSGHIYDYGFDSVQAAKDRAQTNLEAHKARREARGE